MNIDRIKKIKIDFNASLLNALKKMDLLDRKLLLVFDDINFINIISIGDIQRALINNISIDSSIKNILRKNSKLAKASDDIELIKKRMYDFRMEIMPVIDFRGKLLNVYFWEDFFQNKNIEVQLEKQFKLPVVIMAGGRGTRLKPLTNVIPKPLIPINEKTMLEEIFDRFSVYGCKDFFISINYKSELIKYYIENQKNDYKTHYFEEDKPLGTAGSLSLLKSKIKQTFFVTNCDIIINQDYSEILDYHKKNKNDITIVAALKHYPIPYGTIETGKMGELINLTEKPEITFKINSGMYILEPNLLDEIPDDTFFHITELIEKVKKRNGKVGVFPVSEKSWKDIGEWDQFIDAAINKKLK